MCFTPPVSPAAILFDFDGTLSTLRHGWEKVMRPLMLEMIDPQNPTNPALQQEVDEYIDQSTGIQTVYQMEWLAQKVAQHGKNPQVQDKWWYKEEYNRRLMKQVEQRIAQLETGAVAPEAFLIEGSIPLLERLKSTDVSLYVASGTDHDDVVREAKALGVADYFAQILGAPRRQVSCSKEAVIRQLLGEKGFNGSELLVIGDGKVEIALGKEAGARTLGIASDEERRRGIFPIKQRRLEQVGADRIIGDFAQLEELLSWMGLSK